MMKGFKSIFIIICVLCLIFGLCACTKSNKTGDEANIPQANDATDKPSNMLEAGANTYTDSYEESAFSDATTAVTMFLSYQIEEGITSIDDGVVFSVEKGGNIYNYEYISGELIKTDSTEHGSDITPINDSWLANVMVYLP